MERLDTSVLRGDGLDFTILYWLAHCIFWVWEPTIVSPAALARFVAHRWSKDNKDIDLDLARYRATVDLVRDELRRVCMELPLLILSLTCISTTTEELT